VIQSRLALEVAVRLDRGETVERIVAWLAGGDSARQAAAESQVAAVLDSMVALGILVQTTGSSGVIE